MKIVLIATALVLLGALSSYFSMSQEKPRLAPRWKIAFKNNAQGETLSGSKEELINAIRSGSTIKVGWGWQKNGKSMEHISEPIWHLVLNDREVIVHLDPQVLSNTVWDSLSANYIDPALMDLEWRVVLSTRGEFDAVWYDREEHQVVRRLPQRHIMTWFVEQHSLSRQVVPFYSLDAY